MPGIFPGVKQYGACLTSKLLTLVCDFREHAFAYPLKKLRFLYTIKHIHHPFRLPPMIVALTRLSLS